MSSVNSTSLQALNHSVLIKPTNAASTPYDKPFSIHIILVWLVFFLACVIGNGFVCATVYRNKKMRTPTNALIVNLAVADMFTGFASSLTMVDFVMKHFEAGKFWNYFVQLIAKIVSKLKFLNIWNMEKTMIHF